MPQLSVQGFSCINHAYLELHPITLIIGPQASGKSLLSKLLYFFVDLLLSQYGIAERGESYKPFLKTTAKNFSELFPVSAWGDSVFSIKFESGPFVININRKPTANRLSSEVKVTTSAIFERTYTAYFSASQSRRKKRSDDDDILGTSFSRYPYELRRSAMRNLIETLGDEYVERQFFIPAGRSFYTNLGKAVAMFEFGSQLDEITKQFGRQFTSMLDGRRIYYPGEKVSAKAKEFLKFQKESNENILGGKLKLTSGEKYLETRDGRVIPLSLMSSGQQELLPLLLALQSYIDENLEDKDPSVDLLYIEEPEAHLFPSAQADLIIHLAAISNYIKLRSRLFITTHSPYVLSTLNNLVKAASVVAVNPKLEAEVTKIVPRKNWINPGALAAYALEDGVLRSIKDDTGLIDGSYLDGISDKISSKFLSLLELEVSE